ncbi:hypothetical protein T11_6993 [Trichinella zimbabwensis]|uniref:Uncharacterized protein n=1 Tax=Trichinella zimbabwensis TaxID=268475 RepID=A0A0V1GX07_9BILA|nr:hypothetical protein T11_6993 [Trichinella zimbabwensis]
MLVLTRSNLLAVATSMGKLIFQVLSVSSATVEDFLHCLLHVRCSSVLDVAVSMHMEKCIIS